MLGVLSDLFGDLNRQGVRYCHWKSNWVLDETLAGGTDLDVLVHRADADRFRAILQAHGFRPSTEPGIEPFPSVEHHHAIDPASGALAHMHSYYRVISGDSLAKNYRLPFEEMLLHDPLRVGPVNIPSRGAEVVSFVVRMMLKHTALVELAYIVRDWNLVQGEARWLLDDGAAVAAHKELATYLPGFGEGLFDDCLRAIEQSGPLLRRIVLGVRVRHRMRTYQRHGRWHARRVTMLGFASRAIGKARHRPLRLAPGGGGAVIAFVGSEASGKSTTIERTATWLGEQFNVDRLHAGKPPSTALTAAPNALLPMLRALVPGQRTTKVSVGPATSDDPQRYDRPVPLLFAVRSVMLAYDRRALLRRAFARSANGTIVLCDRYPSADPGAPDSAQIGQFASAGSGRGLRRSLARAESALYRDIPPPDLVINLSAPLDVTLERNRSRGKVEPEEFVRLRHAMTANLRFDGAPVHRLDTNRPIDETLADVRRIIWDAL